MQEKNTGVVVQVIGPVLDIRFENGRLPNLLNAIEIPREDGKLICEVAQQLGDDVVRCIAMSSTDGMVQVSTHAARGFIPMMELIDREKELARLNKEKAKAEKELAMFENQLANPKFVERAPAALVEEIRAKRTNSQSKLANIEQSIKALG